jgi:hypothetical protein
VLDVSQENPAKSDVIESKNVTPPGTPSTTTGSTDSPPARLLTPESQGISFLESVSTPFIKRAVESKESATSSATLVTPDHVDKPLYDSTTVRVWEDLPAASDTHQVNSPEYSVKILTVRPERREEASEDEKVEPISLKETFEQAADKLVDNSSGTKEEDAKQANSSTPSTENNAAFGDDMVRVLQRSKEEIQVMRDRWSLATSTEADLDQELGRYIKATKVMACECVDPSSQLDLSLDARDTTTTFSRFQDVETSAVQTISMDVSSHLKPDETLSRLERQFEQTTLRGEEEETSSLVDGENIESALWKRYHTRFKEQATPKHCNGKVQSLYSERKQKERIDGDNDGGCNQQQKNVDSFVAEAQKLFSKAGKSLQNVSVHVRNTMNCTNLADDLLPCHEASTAAPTKASSDWRLKLEMMSDKSWVILTREENCADSISKLTKVSSCNSAFSLDLSEVPKTESQSHTTRGSSIHSFKARNQQP